MPPSTRRGSSAPALRPTACGTLRASGGRLPPLAPGARDAASRPRSRIRTRACSSTISRSSFQLVVLLAA
eukprot:3709379-Pyramimonas_sp.AAC.1